MPSHDYSQPGAYFITVCTQDRERMFGHIADGEMHLNNAGQIIQQVWDELQVFYPYIGTDEFIIMPDHIHGIIMLGAAPCGRPGTDAQFLTSGRPQGAAPTVGLLSLPEIVHRFKSLSTRRVSDAVTNGQAPCFPGRLWQRNYWERVIRDEREMQSVRLYIRNNPAQWQYDDLNDT
jgi:REP element-mobilizing transposase RayT